MKTNTKKYLIVISFLLKSRKTSLRYKKQQNISDNLCPRTSGKMWGLTEMENKDTFGDDGNILYFGFDCGNKICQNSSKALIIMGTFYSINCTSKIKRQIPK